MGWQARRWTSPLRSYPDFIIIGSQKCGTSSLYSYLCRHPYILRASKKEVHFFDEESYSQGPGWYRAHFPTRLRMLYLKWAENANIVTGEASPYYIFFPHAHTRIARLLPRVKLIVMLRNPVDRAFSHYNHQVRKDREPLSFEDALEAEEERLSGEKAAILESNNSYRYNYWAYSYLARGVYADQLRQWLSVFPKEQFLVIRSEDFFTNPVAEYGRTLKFLGVKEFSLERYGKHNTGRYSEMLPETRRYLSEYYRPRNERLYELLDRDLQWD